MNPKMVAEREPALILAYSLRRRNRCFRVWSIGAPYVCEWFRGSMRECSPKSSPQVLFLSPLIIRPIGQPNLGLAILPLLRAKEHRGEGGEAAPPEGALRIGLLQRVGCASRWLGDGFLIVTSGEPRRNSRCALMTGTKNH